METPIESGFWGILELMGHVRLAGYVSEEEKFGGKLGRIDVPHPDGRTTTQFFGGSSVYRLTPCTEEIARSVARHNEVKPIFTFELPALARSAGISLTTTDRDLDGDYRRGYSDPYSTDLDSDEEE
jgi:hypothetical protein